jgi:hypothetical protein
MWEKERLTYETYNDLDKNGHKVTDFRLALLTMSETPP